MQIGQLSAATECSVETIRYYEKQGLLPAPTRSEGNYRIYGETHRERLVFIRRCRSLDMSLEEIRDLLLAQQSGPENCHGIDQLLRQHLDHVAARIKELQGLKQQLRALLSECSQSGSLENCGVLKGLANPAVATASASHIRTHKNSR